MREIEESKSGLVDEDQPPRLRVEFPACMCSAMDVAHHHMGNGNTVIAHDKLGEAFQKFQNVSMSSSPMRPERAEQDVSPVKSPCVDCGATGYCTCGAG